MEELLICEANLLTCCLLRQSFASVRVVIEIESLQVPERFESVHPGMAGVMKESIQ
jgi:hypothetical protein